MQLGLDVHRGLLLTESAEEVRADAESATDGCTGPGAHAGPYSADSSPDAGADAGGLCGWLARLQPDCGRCLLRCWWSVVMWLRGGLRVRRDVLRSSRATHVRANHALPNPGVDSFTDTPAHAGPDACTDRVALLGHLAWLRLAPWRDL